VCLRWEEHEVFEGTSCASSLQLTQIAALDKADENFKSPSAVSSTGRCRGSRQDVVKIRSVKGGERDQAILAPEASQ
jgi:hypothetical protein